MAPRPERIIILRSSDGIDDALQHVKAGTLAIDTETTGLQWWRKNNHRDLVGSINLAAGRTAIFAYRDALGPVALWLADQVRAERKLVFHNAKFDLHFMRETFGLHVPYPVHDTQIQSFLIDNRGAFAHTRRGHGKKQQDHRLKSLAAVFVDRKAKDPEKELMAEIRARGGKHKGDWLLADEKTYAEYSALDPWYTLQLHKQFITQINNWVQPTDDDMEYPSLRSLYETERWLLLALRDMEERGIYCDVEFLHAWGIDLAKKLEDQRRKLIKLAGREINWNSAPQLREVLFRKRSSGGLGLKPERFTAGGDPSTDAATLIELKHEIGPELIRYRELFKQHSSYAISLPEHIDDFGFIHTTLKQTGAETGRMSSSDPNLQQQTRVSGVRKAYKPRKGLVFRLADYCLTGETNVETLKGPKPIRDVQPGDKVYTWRDGAIAWGEVTRHALVGCLPTYRVTLDNGESFCGTGDHEMVLRDGGKIKVRDLVPGTSLAAFRRGTGGPQRRETLYSISNRRYRYTHHIVAEAYLGPRPKGYEVHHIDEDPFNNQPENLCYLERTIHRKLHKHFSNVNESRRLAALRESVQHRRDYSGSENPNWRGGSVTLICEVCGQPFESYPPSRPKKRCSCCRRPGRIPKYALNHKVISIEPVGVKPVYHITVENDHNFALSIGVISANSQVEMRFAGHFSNEEVLIRGFNDDPDFDMHGATAQLLYGHPPEEGTQQRKFAKIMNFTKIFGGGENKITEQLVNLLDHEEAVIGLRELGVTDRAPGVTAWRALAQQLVQRMNVRLPNLIKAIKTEAKTMEQRGFVMNAFGRHRYIDPDRSYKAFNTRVQGTAGDQAKKGLVQLYRELELGEGSIQLLLQIHDENFYESEGDPNVDRRVLELMQDLTTFKVPIIADMSGSAESWQAKEKIKL